jgi:hypothetical protein
MEDGRANAAELEPVYGRPPPPPSSLTDVWLCFGLLGTFTESKTGGGL